MSDHNRVCLNEGPLKVNDVDEFVYLLNDVILFCRDDDFGRIVYAVIDLKLCTFVDITNEDGKGFFFSFLVFLFHFLIFFFS